MEEVKKETVKKNTKKPVSEKASEPVGKAEEIKEEFRVNGSEILNKVKELIAKGNARRIIIKSDKGESVVEIPLTIGAVGVVLAPVLAAVGALTALMTNCTIEVVKRR